MLVRRLRTTLDAHRSSPRSCRTAGQFDGMGEAAVEALVGVLDPCATTASATAPWGLPLDLTGVLFVAVATDPGRIPPLLRERLEALPAVGCTDAEKQRSATAHLVPHRRGQHGLFADELSFSPAPFRLLTGDYSLEPGVRPPRRRALPQGVGAPGRGSSRARGGIPEKVLGRAGRR